MKHLFLGLSTVMLLAACDKKEAEVQQLKNVETGSDSVQLKVAQDTVAAADETSMPHKVKSVQPLLNPEHGQPNHRCDIPVGAPLDSAPQAAAPQLLPPAQPAPTQNFNTVPIAPSVATDNAAGPKPATNPPHGEPHHRCDLQVGAPLT